jgi:ATP-dependent Clp protease ATP-binding subunit ClpA
VLFELTEEARKWLAVRGYDRLYGARPLARIIQEHVKKPLADEILFGKLKDGGVVKIRVEDDKLVFEFPPPAAEKPPAPPEPVMVE